MTLEQILEALRGIASRVEVLESAILDALGKERRAAEDAKRAIVRAREPKYLIGEEEPDPIPADEPIPMPTVERGYRPQDRVTKRLKLTRINPPGV